MGSKNLPEYLIAKGAGDDLLTYIVRVQDPLCFGVIGEHDHRIMVRSEQPFEGEESCDIPEKMLEVYGCEEGQKLDSYEVIETGNLLLPEWLVCKAAVRREDLCDYLFVVETGSFRVISFILNDDSTWIGKMEYAKTSIQSGNHGVIIMRRARDVLDKYLMDGGSTS